MAWAKISIVGCKDLYVSSYNRPKADDKDSLDLLFSSLDRIYNIPRNATFGLLVIFFLSDLHKLFVESLDDYGLTQMVDKPTGLGGTLDLFILTIQHSEKVSHISDRISRNFEP